MHVEGKVRHHAGRGEHGTQSLFNVTRLMRLIANQHQRVRPFVGGVRQVTIERRLRHRQFAIDVVEVFGQRRVVGHPHQVVGHEPDDALEIFLRLPLSNEVGDLPPQFPQKALLPRYEISITPRAKPGNDVAQRKPINGSSAASHAAVSQPTSGTRGP